MKALNIKKYNSFLDIPISKLNKIIEYLNFDAINSPVISRTENMITSITYYGKESQLIFQTNCVIESKYGDYVQYITWNEFLIQYK